MQTILDLKKELINSGWWDIDERISSDGWGNGKIGYTIWIRRPDWHGKAAFSLTGGSVKLHAACDDAFNEAKVIETLENQETASHPRIQYHFRRLHSAFQAMLIPPVHLCLPQTA